MKRNGKMMLALVCACFLALSFAGFSTAKAEQSFCIDNHSWNERRVRVVREATCTEQGEEIWAICCENCPATTGEPWTENPMAKGHDFGEPTPVTTEATCTGTGLVKMEATCRTCGAKDIQSETIIPAKGHDFGEPTSITKEATCTENGFVKMVATCRTCGAQETQSETIIPAKGHEPNAYEETVRATCEEGGWTYRVVKCAKCQADISKELISFNDKTGHKWGEWRMITQATCETGGEERRSCTNEGCAVEEVRYSDPVPHIWGKWKTVTPATCEEKGKEVHECIYGHSQTRAVKPLGHQWTEWRTITPATPTSEGLAVRVCTRDARHCEEKKLPIIFGVQLTDQTTVGVLGLMEYDEAIFKNKPVILVNGKSLSQLTSEERRILQSEKGPTAFLMIVMELVQQGVKGDQYSMLEIEGLTISIDTSRLGALVNEARKRQAEKEKPIDYNEEKEEEELFKIHLEFRERDEQIKFESQGKSDEVVVQNLDQSYIDWDSEELNDWQYFWLEMRITLRMMAEDVFKTDIEKIQEVPVKIFETLLFKPGQKVAHLVINGYDWVYGTAQNAWMKTKDWTSDVFEIMTDGLKRTGQDLIENVKDKWNNMWKEAGYAGGRIADKVDELKSSFVDKLMDRANNIRGNVERVQEMAGEAVETVKEKAGEAVETVKEKVGDAVETVKEKVGGVFGKIQDKSKWLQEQAQKAWENASQQVKEEVKEKAGKAVEQVKETVNTVVETVVDKVQEGAEKVAGFFKGLFRR